MDNKAQVEFILTKRLYEKGFSKKDVINLYKFLDWLIGLPEHFELEYLNKVYELEETTKMAYITFAERHGVEKGKLEVATHLLEEGVDLAVIAKSTGFSLIKIKELQQKLKKKQH